MSLWRNVDSEQCFYYVLVCYRSLPWSRRDSTISSSPSTRTKRRESSADLIKGKLTAKPSIDKPIRRGSITTIKRIVTSPGNHIVPINLIPHTFIDQLVLSLSDIPLFLNFSLLNSKKLLSLSDSFPSFDMGSLSNCYVKKKCNSEISSGG
jgi:hypothetical protein